MNLSYWYSGDKNINIPIMTFIVVDMQFTRWQVQWLESIVLKGAGNGYYCMETGTTLPSRRSLGGVEREGNDHQGESNRGGCLNTSWILPLRKAWGFMSLLNCYDLELIANDKSKKTQEKRLFPIIIFPQYLQQTNSQSNSSSNPGISVFHYAYCCVVSRRLPVGDNIDSLGTSWLTYHFLIV